MQIIINKGLDYIRFSLIVIVQNAGTQPMKCSQHLTKSAINNIIYSVIYRSVGRNTTYRYAVNIVIYITERK